MEWVTWLSSNYRSLLSATGSIGHTNLDVTPTSNIYSAKAH
jgi:hypothetical protein